MSKVIYIKKPTVNIDFKTEDGELVESFEFDKTDDNIKSLITIQNKFFKRIGQLEASKKEFGVKELLKEMNVLIDEMLGEGAYDRLYELAGSWDLLIYYFVHICNAIAEETHANIMGDMDKLLSKYTNE